MSSGGLHDKSVAREGYLSKRGHLVPNWKMRYFVLKSDDGTCTLQYYKSAQLEGGPQGSIELKGASLDVPRYDDPKTKWFSFSIREAKVGTKAGRIYPLRCLSGEDKTAWAAALSVDIKIASNSSTSEGEKSSEKIAFSKEDPVQDGKSATTATTAAPVESPGKTTADGSRQDEMPKESPQGMKSNSSHGEKGNATKVRKGQLAARHIVRPKESDASMVRPGARTMDGPNLGTSGRRVGRTPEPPSSSRQRGHSPPPKPKNCLNPDPEPSAPLPMPPSSKSKLHPSFQSTGADSEGPSSSMPQQLPIGWAQAATPQKKTYYYHAASGTTSWERPHENTPIPPMPSTIKPPKSPTAEPNAIPATTDTARDETETAKSLAEQTVKIWLGTRDLAALLADLSTVHPKCCPASIDLPAKPTPTEVKKAYRAAARALHPDKARAGALVPSVAATAGGGKDGGASGAGGKDNAAAAANTQKLTEDDAVLAEVLFTALAGLYAAFERKVQRAAELEVT